VSAPRKEVLVNLLLTAREKNPESPFYKDNCPRDIIVYIYRMLLDDLNKDFKLFIKEHYENPEDYYSLATKKRKTENQ
jgi:hypothetical protein